MNRLLLHISMAVLLLFSFLSLAHAFILPDSGQLKCYQSVYPYAEISCEGTGQDGAYSINPMSYTDNGDETVIDNNTGLIWQKQDDGFTYNWYQANGVYDAVNNPDSIDVCGNLTLGGWTDWRLPSKIELITIVDYSIPYPGPAINSAYFQYAKSFGYWTSSAYAYSPEIAWSSSFVEGGQWPRYKAEDFYVRCVRGEPAPQQTLVDNGNGTVTDSSIGLMWQQDDPGAMTWDVAISYCENLSLGGESDWRLPNVKELQSIADITRALPAIDTAFFPQAKIDRYLTSTTDPEQPRRVWYVYFNFSGTELETKSGDTSVRCVRGGHSAILTVNATGNGAGTVSSDIGDISINYPTEVSDVATIDPNSFVTLTAAPAQGSTFASWTGCDNVSGNQCSVTMTGAKTVTAAFAQPTTIITVVTPNGGEKLEPESSYRIRWNYAGDTGAYVRIELLKGGVLKRTIRTSISRGTNGVGSYLWSIPEEISTGTDYKIRITSISNPTYQDGSDANFTICDEDDCGGGDDDDDDDDDEEEDDD